jgi:hypothetical protein
MFHEIGTVVEGTNLSLRKDDGKTVPLDVTGWEHQL